MTWPEGTTAAEAAQFISDWLVTHGHACSYEATVDPRCLKSEEEHLQHPQTEHVIETTPVGLAAVMDWLNHPGFDDGFGEGWRCIDLKDWDDDWVSVYDDLGRSTAINTTPVRT